MSLGGGSMCYVECIDLKLGHVSYCTGHPSFGDKCVLTSLKEAVPISAQYPHMELFGWECMINHQLCIYVHYKSIGWLC